MKGRGGRGGYYWSKLGGGEGGEGTSGICLSDTGEVIIGAQACIEK